MTRSASAIDLQRQFYNDRWHDFTFANRLKLERCIAILEALRSTRIREPRIIDLGCGSGWLASILGVFGPTTAVDLSDVAIDEAQKRYSHVNFYQADIMNWEYPEEAFDIAVSQEVIEYVEDQDRYLRIARGLLRTGGFLILTTPNARTFYALPEEVRKAWSNQPIENWISIAELRKLLKPHFDILHISTIIPGYGVKGSYRFVNSQRFYHVLKLLRLHNTFDWARLKAGYGLHTIAVAQKRP